VRDKEKVSRFDKKEDTTRTTENGVKLISLKDIMTANPGISMPEAVIRLNAYNTAVTRGLPPPSIVGITPLSVVAAAAAAGSVATSGSFGFLFYKEFFYFFCKFFSLFTMNINDSSNE
jgi:hypothetical protein